MAAPIRPGRSGSTPDVPPCASCGGRAVLEDQVLERELGEVEAETIQVRVCTNPDCETNGPERSLDASV